MNSCANTSITNTYKFPFNCADFFEFHFHYYLCKSNPSVQRRVRPPSSHCECIPVVTGSISFCCILVLQAADCPWGASQQSRHTHFLTNDGNPGFKHIIIHVYGCNSNDSTGIFFLFTAGILEKRIKPLLICSELYAASQNMILQKF